MDDIARGVGLSRPALYLAYPNKEAVFREVVRVGLDELLAELEREVAAPRSLPEQLTQVFRISSLRSYQLVSRSPAAGELMSASFDFVKDLFDGYDRRLIELLARLIRAAVAEPEALQPPALARARVMVAAAQGFKATARDAREFEALLGDLVQVVVAGLPQASGGAPAPPRRRRSARRRTQAG
jgi:AcrR family transcriptional regulator